MIVVRNVFRLKFGKARDAIALAKEAEEIGKRHGGAPSRYLTDLTGEFYTLVMETSYESLAAMEKEQNAIMGKKEFSEWYQKFIPLVESGYREMFNVVIG